MADSTNKNNTDAIVQGYLASLAKLKAQPPKPKSGKSESLKLIKDELVQLVKSGFTRTQIIEAFKNDGFNIIPSTLRSVLGDDLKQKRKPVKKRLNPQRGGATRNTSDLGTRAFSKMGDEKIDKSDSTTFAIPKSDPSIF